MGCNVGKTDKVIRFLIAAAAVGASFLVGGVAAYVLWGAAVVMVATSAVSFCPIYRALGLNTCGA